jgi:hypothetical protein
MSTERGCASRASFRARAIVVSLGSIVVSTLLATTAGCGKDINVYRCEEPQNGTCHESGHYMTASECWNGKRGYSGCPWLGRKGVCESTRFDARTYSYRDDEGRSCPADGGWTWRRL